MDSTEKPINIPTVTYDSKTRVGSVAIEPPRRQLSIRKQCYRIINLIYRYFPILAKRQTSLHGIIFSFVIVC